MRKGIALKKILIVEDDEPVRKMLARLLRGKERDLCMAGTGQEALDAIRVQRPDLILLDFFLPDMVAVTFMSQIKNMYPAIPIIIVSNFWNMEYAKLAAQQGAVDFIPKPIDPQQLVEIVNIRLSEGTAA